jgi:hypothetical protein
MHASILRLCGLAAIVALLMPDAAVHAQNIYKCSKAGQVVYTDQPCAGDRGTLLHQADATDIIDQYLRLGQVAQAERYAQTHHLEALYRQRLATHRQNLAQRERLQDEAFAAAQQRDAEARALAAANAAADAERLRAENDALRQQNAQYQSQLAQPVYAPPAAWYPPPRYPYRHSRPGRPYDLHPTFPPQSSEPVFHPCQQLAGGRVKC